MCGGSEADFEATVRRAFTRLTRDELPRAAADRGWPVRTTAEFERLLLDHLREGTSEAQDPSLVDLVLAVELGERLLAGNCCCTRMNGRRGEGAKLAEPLAALLAATPRAKLH
jgi:hypothetical protein